MTHTIALMKVSHTSFSDIMSRIKALGPDYAAMIHVEGFDNTTYLNLDGVGLVVDDADKIIVDQAALKIAQRIDALLGQTFVGGPSQRIAAMQVLLIEELKELGV